MKTPRTPEGRVAAVAHGGTINGTYARPPVQVLELFRRDLKELCNRPTQDAYMAACRAGHWRMAELRAHGIEPLNLTKVADLTHYPPDDYDFGAPAAPLKIGDAVEVVEGSADWSADWAGWRGHVAGIQSFANGRINFTVSDRWPVEGNGDLTDGFGAEMLRRVICVDTPQIAGH